MCQRVYSFNACLIKLNHGMKWNQTTKSVNCVSILLRFLGEDDAFVHQKVGKCGKDANNSFMCLHVQENIDLCIKCFEFHAMFPIC